MMGVLDGAKSEQLFQIEKMERARLIFAQKTASCPAILAGL